MSKSKKELIGLIKRQTDYSEEIILEKLEKYSDDIEKIILEYNGIAEIKQDNVTTNQKIFRAIRNNMDEIYIKKNLRK